MTICRDDIQWDNPSVEREKTSSRKAQGCPLISWPVIQAVLTCLSHLPCLQPLGVISLISFAFSGLALVLSLRHRFGFIRCEVRPARLIRRLEVHFLQNLPPVESIWQEKPSYEADKTAVCCICKTPKRFREKGTEEREK